MLTRRSPNLVDQRKLHQEDGQGGVLLRKLAGVLGGLVAVMAILPLLVSGFCVYTNVAYPRQERRSGVEVPWLNPGLEGLWANLPVLLVSALAIWGGIMLCKWAFATPRRQPKAHSDSGETR